MQGDNKCESIWVKNQEWKLQLYILVEQHVIYVWWPNLSARCQPALQLLANSGQLEIDLKAVSVRIKSTKIRSWLIWPFAQPSIAVSQRLRSRTAPGSNMESRTNPKEHGQLQYLKSTNIDNPKVSTLWVASITESCINNHIGKLAAGTFIIYTSR